MNWDSSLESNIPVIDHEHRELVEQLSRLVNESNPEHIQQMLDFLKEYVVKHFAHEQVMHRKLAYPKTDEHKATHVAFVSTFLELEEEYVEKGSNPEMLQKIVAILNDWLKNHIMGQDKDFADYVHALAIEGRVRREDIT